MQRLTSALAAATLTAGLLSLSQPASAEDCPDINDPIARFFASGADLVLEPVDAEHVVVAVEGFAGCFEMLGPPTARAFTPERQFDVPLVRAPDPYWGTARFEAASTSTPPTCRTARRASGTCRRRSRAGSPPPAP